MATNYVSPNMSLIIPVPTQELGPNWAYDLNASLTNIDAHNHTAGKGVLVPVAGLLINDDLNLNLFNLTSVRTTRYAFNASALALPTDLQCAYAVGMNGDLFWNDGNGNQVRITQSGSVAGSAGTITGLPNGTASAAFSGIEATFIFQSATGVGANMDIGSLIVRYPGTYPTPSGTNFIVLQVPSSIVTGYSITLPPQNTLGATGVVTLSTANVLDSISFVDIATDMGSAGADIIAGNLTAAGVSSIVTAMTSTDADTIAGKMTVAGCDQIAATMDATGTAFIASTMSPTSSDVIAVKVTATGADSIAGVMTATGADTIASKFTSSGTGFIATTMTAANANTIRNKETRAFSLVNGGTGAVAFSNPISVAISGTGALATITLNTIGRPVMVYFLSDRNVFPNEAQISSSGNAVFQLRNSNSGQVCGAYNYQPNNGPAVMAPVIVGIDNPAAGAQAYTVEVTAASGTTVVANYMIMAYEL